MPLYRRFTVLEATYQSSDVQSCLDLAWSGASGNNVSSGQLERCKERLGELAPELEVRPILAYAAMECAASTWDALATLEDGTVDHAIDALGGYARTIEHFLINRDHQGVLVATKQPDPLGLGNDPIWSNDRDRLNRLTNALKAAPAPDTQTIRHLQIEAEDDTQGLVDSMVELSVSLSRGG